MGLSSKRSISPGPAWARRTRTLLIAVTLAIGPAVLGWTPPGVPATARADCCGMLGPIGSLMALGDTLVFTAHDARHGWELWRSDGTAEGTRLVKDIRPGKRGSGPENADCEGCSDAEDSRPLFAGLAGGNLILWADDGEHGLEPWRSDGSARGTRLLRDIRPGKRGSGSRNAEPGAAVDGVLYFGVDDGTHRTALWRTDGTAPGTTLVTDFGGSDRPVGVSQLTPADEGIFFTSASPESPGPELWRSDGTAEGTLLVAASDNGSGLQDLVWVGGALYFADQGAEYVPDGSRLWRSDGTPQGTFPIKQPISLAVPFVTAIGETVYFGHTAYDNEVEDGWLTRLEVWRTDGTPQGTTLVTALERDSPIWFEGRAVIGESSSWRSPPGVARSCGEATARRTGRPS